MKADEIRKLLHEQPFRAFIVHVADGGGRLLVKHEDYVALAPSGREMIIYRHNKPDDYEVVDVMLITRLEVAARNESKKPPQVSQPIRGAARPQPVRRGTAAETGP